MHGWFNSRYATPPDVFSEQHDSTLKLIATKLDPQSADNLSRVNRRTRVLFTDPYQRVDMQVDRLRSQYTYLVHNLTPEDVDYLLESKTRLYGDAMSMAEYLSRLNYEIEHGRLLDKSRYTRLWRVIYEVGKTKHIQQFNDDFKEQILEAALNNVDAAICFDGKILDEPNEQTFPNIGNILYWVLVGHKHVRNARHSWEAVPVASLRACKHIFTSFGADNDDAALAITNAVFEAEVAERSVTLTDNISGMIDEILQPDFFAGTLFGPLPDSTGHRSLTPNQTPAGRHVAENILDRVDFIITPEISQRLIPGQLPRMRAIYAEFDRIPPF